MANLKELKGRINSVKSTIKITSAMKMVSTANLRKAKNRVLSARPYLHAMEGLVGNIATHLRENRNLDDLPELLIGRKESKTVLIVYVSSDRGLCGGLNGNLFRYVRSVVRAYDSQGKKVKFLCLGKKGYQQVKSYFGEESIVGYVLSSARKGVDENVSLQQGEEVLRLFNSGEVDQVEVYFNTFISAISQEIKGISLIPAEYNDGIPVTKEAFLEVNEEYTYEPSSVNILKRLLVKNIKTQLHRALLENFASEQGARMTAMDSATKNADDLIKKLTLSYNNTRQSIITNELIEIISGAEAL